VKSLNNRTNVRWCKTETAKFTDDQGWWMHRVTWVRLKSRTVLACTRTLVYLSVWITSAWRGMACYAVSSYRKSLSNTRRNVLPFLTFCPTANIGSQHDVREPRLCWRHVLRLEYVEVKGLNGWRIMFVCGSLKDLLSTADIMFCKTGERNNGHKQLRCIS
jgi:hypothetical protein